MSDANGLYFAANSEIEAFVVCRHRFLTVVSIRVRWTLLGQRRRWSVETSSFVSTEIKELLRNEETIPTD